MTRKRRGSHPERSEIAAQIVKQGGVVIDEPGIYWEIPKANLDAFLERLGVILADQVLADFAAKQREPANPDPCPQTESATYTGRRVGDHRHPEIHRVRAGAPGTRTPRRDSLRSFGALPAHGDRRLRSRP